VKSKPIGVKKRVGEKKKPKVVNKRDPIAEAISIKKQQRLKYVSQGSHRSIFFGMQWRLRKKHPNGGYWRAIVNIPGEGKQESVPNPDGKMDEVSIAREANQKCLALGRSPLNPEWCFELYDEMRG